MKNNHRNSLAAFLVALSAISISENAAAAVSTPNSNPTAAHQGSPPNIEERLSRLSIALKALRQQLPAEASVDIDPSLLARGFADGGNRGDWVNGRRGGWVDGGGGGDFYNVNRWRNGWGDGGGFINWYNN